MADDESWLYGEEGEGGEEEQAVPEQTPDQSQEEQVAHIFCKLTSLTNPISATTYYIRL